jgi:hypothetical protein
MILEVSRTTGVLNGYKAMEVKTHYGISGLKRSQPVYHCRNKVYEVGKTAKQSGEVRLCDNGIHFCLKVEQVFDYYKFDLDTIQRGELVVAEVETTEDAISEMEVAVSPYGAISDSVQKVATNKLTIKRILPYAELMEFLNDGKYNEGIGNIGHNNIGNNNIGNNNIGSFNTGNNNVGDWNVGNDNVGDNNKGDNNKGH